MIFLGFSDLNLSICLYKLIFEKWNFDRQVIYSRLSIVYVFKGEGAIKKALKLKLQWNGEVLKESFNSFKIYSFFLCMYLEK